MIDFYNITNVIFKDLINNLINVNLMVDIN